MTARGLRFEDATVGYGGSVSPVLTGVSLAVERGCLIGLVGPNGAGKTTMLRAVTGEARVSSGALTLDGEPVGALDAAARARRVGVLPQASPVTFSFSARDYVMLGRHARMQRFGGPGATDDRVVDEAMRLTDTERLATVPVDTLSGGDLQRLTLAQALAQEPELLLLDEPTSHLDLDHTLQVLDLVRGLADDGMAVMAVFHDLGLAARYSDRIAVVSEGALRRVGPPEEVIDPAMLAEVFHVKAVVGPDPVTGAPSITPVARDSTLPAPSRGKVLLVCGSGTGSRLMRRLRLAGFEVHAGALNVGDTDEQVARALGVPFVALPPFGAVDETARAQVAQWAGGADLVVVAATPFGGANLDNLRAALGAGRPAVIVGGSAPQRDFTGGEAARMLDDAIGSGTKMPATDEEAFAMIDEMMP